MKFNKGVMLSWMAKKYLNKEKGIVSNNEPQNWYTVIIQEEIYTVSIHPNFSLELVLIFTPFSSNNKRQEWEGDRERERDSEREERERDSRGGEGRNRMEGKFIRLE